MTHNAQWPVINRDQLPDTIRTTLIPLPRDEWQDHENYLIGNARALLNNHRGLKRQARRFVSELEQQLGQQQAGEQALLTGRSLLRNLHSHHGYEDSSVFPQLRLYHPRMAAAFDLLEQDHELLEQQLHSLGLLLKNPAQDNATYWPQLHNLAQDLETLLTRHMDDEEEIIVPVYLTYM